MQIQARKYEDQAESDWRRFVDCLAFGECWIYQGSISNRGYGLFRAEGRTQLAHRYAYKQLAGPIPDGLQLDHVKDLCTSKACAKPSHLEPVTPRENLMRGDTIAAANAAKVACPKGHPYDYVNPSTAARGCKTCNRDKMRRRRADARAKRKAT
jgi:hypothetical protein